MNRRAIGLAVSSSIERTHSTLLCGWPLQHLQVEVFLMALISKLELVAIDTL